MENTDILLWELRNQIDTIDKEIVYLLSRRFNLVESIWDVKKITWMQALQPNRWQEVLDLLTNHCEEFWVDEKLVHNIYELIHNHSLKIEK